jgi:hypothetical protein
MMRQRRWYFCIARLMEPVSIVSRRFLSVQERFLMTTLILVLGSTLHVRAAGTAPTVPYGPDAKVEMGPDGKLKYTPDKRGNQIPDFSRCGYMGGGVKLPDLPVKLTLKPRPGMERALEVYSPETAGEGDDAERIQKAIDDVGAMPLDKNGFRGAVLLKRGIYRVAKALVIKASGVVLRGEGQEKDGTIIIATDQAKRTVYMDTKSNAIIADGARKITEVPGSRREIADSYVPWGVTSFNLKSAAGLSVGDKVVVFRPNTEQWLKDLGMTGIWRWKTNPHAFDLHFERTIMAIDGNRITLDGPTVNAMEDKYGGGFVYKYAEEGGISQIGVENLRLISAYAKGGKNGDTDEDHTWGGVWVKGCLNSWVRNVSAVHFVFACAHIDKNSKYVTIQDCSYLKPISSPSPGRRYPYQYDDAQFCLIQRCTSELGRHCNSCSGRVRGPNVWLDMDNKGGDVGPHHRWSTGILYDSVKGGTFVAQNRGTMGSGHGWVGGQLVFWNCTGYSTAIAQPPTARNYVFGMSVAKGDYSKQKPVKPRSLYLQQVEERLGKQAVENVTTERQR